MHVKEVVLCFIEPDMQPICTFCCTFMLKITRLCGHYTIYYYILTSYWLNTGLYQPKALIIAGLRADIFQYEVNKWCIICHKIFEDQSFWIFFRGDQIWMGSNIDTFLLLVLNLTKIIWLNFGLNLNYIKAYIKA